METHRGLSVTTQSLQVIDSINYFHQQVLGAGKEPHNILEAVKINPDNLLLQVYTAALYLYGQTDPATALAKKHLLQAEKLLNSVNLREKLTYHAVKAWMNLEYETALTILDALTGLYPRDTLAAKFAEWLFYCSGQAYNSHNYLKFCERIAAHNQDESHFLAMHSFAAELSGHLLDAQRLAEQALTIEPLTPWAHHTLAHIYLNTNNSAKGIATLETFRGSWENISTLLRGHNSWHLALFYLALRHDDKVMDLYPVIFGTSPEIITEQIDAISLLWRLDMAGFPQLEQFNVLGRYLDENPFTHYTGFNTVHYVYCLTRLGQEDAVQRALASIETYAQTLAMGYNQSLWRSVILPLSKGIHAFVNNDFQSACDLMGSCISRYTEIGGSDAQLEIIAQTYLLCLLHSNKKKAAKEFFNFHLAHYKGTPLAEFWFSSKLSF
ncbi:MULTISPECIES: tetratricopeptide repeat protein [Legionella]|uniref:Tetratricopeptide repeat protein 38 n=1 Tax=Legionella resiliens TaxID=2905958 RepID=A0ABS8X9Z8_9GAMM|nr:MULTISPECIES: tetratricopeptide repeat protein [unclassified Legionella]MCE0724656.1 tetratricopeptide repeat protein [Legionella sp. 9fVS26]MCE3533810.1 tetratricopeptide repeat protein [Legionella sp. 8cVS16]QLZ70009.1 tetratricopeptide repeat-containing protein [Legionella sp. PC1000]